MRFSFTNLCMITLDTLFTLLFLQESSKQHCYHLILQLFYDVRLSVYQLQAFEMYQPISFDVSKANLTITGTITYLE